ncbi:MAG TPA: carbon monoxide dehydrogenase subunit G [Hyphomicrobiaceae bacterium]|jgi:carbon monoxide dehydrogenase subunit G|nr:carbon monoxide dehydrogenase subunit G [Hyphomicrobiaceae bacterium]
MDITGQYRIAAPRDVVWAALNDPEVLKVCIPGCKELEKRSDREFKAKVALKIGPISANFSGAVTLEDLNPPAGYTIVGQGQGGAAGFAKGRAKVDLTEEGQETTLSYTAKAEVGGKLATLGGRLIQATSKKLADEFFGKFAAELGGVEEPAAAAPDGAPPQRKESRWKRWFKRG